MTAVITIAITIFKTSGTGAPPSYLVFIVQRYNI
jgi:hypothetical protein